MAGRSIRRLLLLLLPLLLLTSRLAAVVEGHDGAYDVEGKHPHGGSLQELLLEERELSVTMERQRTLIDYRREKQCW